MHSLQIHTCGPAISRSTWLLVFWQNEHAGGALPGLGVVVRRSHRFMGSSIGPGWAETAG